MTLQELINEYVSKETRLNLDIDSFPLLNRLLNEHGYDLLITRASVGDKIVAVVKSTETPTKGGQ